MRDAKHIEAFIKLAINGPVVVKSQKKLREEREEKERYDEIFAGAI